LRIIVVGCGTAGSRFAVTLARDGHEVTVVDRNPDAFARLGSEFPGATLTGVAIDEDVLREAGAEQADALAALTGSDSTNLVVGQLALRRFRIPRVLVRVREPEKEEVFGAAGLSIFCPTKLLVQEWARYLGVGGKQPCT